MISCRKALGKGGVDAGEIFFGEWVESPTDADAPFKTG
jgi:hypothetical protein